ncbi:sulfurtransferase tusE [Glaciecola punicea ACAM 611]|uniref:Sulfurtransferase n=1 Tax=Glaciecola punicea ACAM 611 TaxID=1121923 RepID=H5T9R1_9ALTE|nr:TusE/DsrC/DsvC family sulfur relay protein [Glaciecola punicea]GAB55038.1 sulfurtransferase tusE [Glaciecola punicea ACAM 611]
MNTFSIIVNGVEIETDKEGYLRKSEQWNNEVAQHIAYLENIEMTGERWQIVHFVRDFYTTYDTSPAMRALVKALQRTHGPDKGNSRYLYRLFPKGPAKIPTKLAGLPKPAKCL